MTSQVVVNIDTELKKKAMFMAKKEGLTMKALMSFLLKWYVEKDISLWARYNKKCHNDIEIIPWSDDELDSLNNDIELKELEWKFNKLIADKWILS